MVPSLWQDPLAEIGYPAQHPYVRRYWTAAIGPGAVADLLRLSAAASRGRPLRRPLHLSVLISENLVRAEDGRLLVRSTVPPLPSRHARRLPPALRAEHAATRWPGPHRP